METREWKVTTARRHLAFVKRYSHRNLVIPDVCLEVVLSPMHCKLSSWSRASITLGRHSSSIQLYHSASFTHYFSPSYLIWLLILLHNGKKWQEPTVTVRAHHLQVSPELSNSLQFLALLRYKQVRGSFIGMINESDLSHSMVLVYG